MTKNYAALLNILAALSLAGIFSCEKQQYFYDSSGQLKADIVVIDQFLADSNIVALKSTSGLRYVIHDTGFGEYPTLGSSVTMNYRGTLLDGTEFDSSYDNPTAFNFSLGYNQVISGVDEGIQYIREGGSITLYIPSPLAYGRSSPTELIKANSILIFHIELISVQ
jgi:FKBP-type peptidyl-prolyl cis-trans isomerase